MLAMIRGTRNRTEPVVATRCNASAMPTNRKEAHVRSGHVLADGRDRRPGVGALCRAPHRPEPARCHRRHARPVRAGIGDEAEFGPRPSTGARLLRRAVWTPSARRVVRRERPSGPGAHGSPPHAAARKGSRRGGSFQGARCSRPQETSAGSPKHRTDSKLISTGVHLQVRLSARKSGAGASTIPSSSHSACQDVSCGGGSGTSTHVTACPRRARMLRYRRTCPGPDAADALRCRWSCSSPPPQTGVLLLPREIEVRIGGAARAWSHPGWFV